MMMLGRLYYYFGVTGILSVLLWAASLYLLMRFGWRPERTRRYFAALGLAVLALFLAGINSSHINAIRPDMSEEIKAARERGEQLAREQEAAARKKAGHGTETPTNIYEAAASDTTAPGEPSYRTKGKVGRDKSKIEQDKVLTQTVAPAAEQESGRLMKQEDMFRAQRWDRVNLFTARFTFWLAVFLVVLDYVRRFNRTFGCYSPLPLACRPMDALSPKAHTVHVRVASPAALEQYLKSSVKKGESFICFGGEEGLGLVPGDGRIHRMTLRDVRPWILPGLVRGAQAIHRENLPVVRKLTAWMGNRRDTGLLPVEIVPCRPVSPGATSAVRAGMEQAVWPERVVFQSNFVFESTWFGRYSFVVADGDLSAVWLGEWMDFLRMRQHVLASVRRTVNVIWNAGRTITADGLREIIFLCEETNCRFILVGQDEEYAGLADAFDEVWPEMPVVPAIEGGK